MRILPAGLRAHLDSGATTLCWCWRLIRRDGVVLGFTDHDRNISFDATVFEADSGMSASEIEDSVGLSVDNLEVDGAITSERLSPDDLAAGLYDDARIEIFRVNWTDPEQRILMRSGHLGEVKRTQTAFAAEVRGLGHYLQQSGGRLFQYTCDATLGDLRCGVELGVAAYTASVTIAAIAAPNVVLVDGLGDYADGWFARGRLTFLSGANAGHAFEIKDHRAQGASWRLTLWATPARDVAPGDGAELVTGCDKTLVTCRAKFGNAANFRGFPVMPGADLLTRFASRR